MDPVAEKIEASLDLAVADLRDYMARARRLRLQFDHAKNAELTAYRKVQSCQESLQYCYANNPFGGMSDIIERRKTQLADAEKQWQDATMYAAQLRSEVAEISEMEIDRFQSTVAQRMRDQDGQELAVANEMIVDATTQNTAPRSLEAIKVVSKEGDIRTAMVYGSLNARPTTTRDRTMLMSRSSPSHGEGTVIAGRIGSAQHFASKDDSIFTGPNMAGVGLIEAAASAGGMGNSSVNSNALSHGSPARAQSATAALNGSNAIGNAIAVTAYNTSARTMPFEEPQSSGLRTAAVQAGVVPGLRNGTPQLNDIRPTSQSAMKMASVSFGNDAHTSVVVVARPGHYKEQTALLASESAEDALNTPAAGRLTHIGSLEGNPQSYKASTKGDLPPIPLSPSQQRALQHSPFFRPGSALVYAAADAAAVSVQYQDNLDNSKCIPLQPHQISRERRPMSRPAYYASPTAEKSKYSVSTPNTPLTEAELEEVFYQLDTDDDGLLYMLEAANHFDKIGTFGVPNHGKKFVSTNLRRPYEQYDTVTFDEFSYLVAKWGTL